MWSISSLNKHIRISLNLLLSYILLSLCHFRILPSASSSLHPVDYSDESATYKHNSLSFGWTRRSARFIHLFLRPNCSSISLLAVLTSDTNTRLNETDTCRHVSSAMTGHNMAMEAAYDELCDRYRNVTLAGGAFPQPSFKAERSKIREAMKSSPCHVGKNSSIPAISRCCQLTDHQTLFAWVEMKPGRSTSGRD